MTNTRWAIILCKFSDQPQEPQTPKFYRSAFTEEGAGTGGAFDYWRDVSFGKLDLTGSRVFGWFTMSRSTKDLTGMTFPRDRGTLITFGREVAAANGVDLSEFFGNIVVFNTITDSGATGTGQVVIGFGGDWSPTFNAHEMGHAFGLDHSFGISPNPCASGDGRPGAYCDKWDIMSAMNVFSFPNALGNNGPGLNAAYLDKLGCIPPDRIFSLKGPGNSDPITLAALEDPQANGFLMAKIPPNATKPAGTSTYTIEFRRKIGWDAGIPRDCVLIHEVRSDGLSLLQEIESGPELLPPHEFIDSKRNLGIRIIGIDPGSRTATVVFIATRSLRRFLADRQRDPSQGIKKLMRDASLVSVSTLLDT